MTDHFLNPKFLINSCQIEFHQLLILIIDQTYGLFIIEPAYNQI